MIPAEQLAAALSGPYAGDVAEWLSWRDQGVCGDQALDFCVLLERARRPGDMPELSGEQLDYYRNIVRAAAGLAGVRLGGQVPASAVPGKPLTCRQEAVLAVVASFGITNTAAGSSQSLRRRGLAEKVPGWTWESPGLSWRLTAAGLAEAARVLVITGKACGVLPACLGWSAGC